MTGFHKAGKNSAGKTEYRGKCKRCSNAKVRSTQHKPVRSPEYLKMPEEKRLYTYEQAIARMRQFGIMSEETADASLRRVRGT